MPKRLMIIFVFLILMLPPNTFRVTAAEPQKINVNGVQLNYIREGSGNPVVMIHGSYSSLNAYSLSIFQKVAQKFDAIALDLPGFGASARPKYKMTLDERIQLIHDEIEKLGIRKPVLVGHSAGGAFVLHYALKYPEETQALVLLAPYTKPYEKANKVYRVTAKPVLGDLFLWLIVKPTVFFKRPSRMLKPGFHPDPPNKDYATKEVKLAIRRKTFKSNAFDLIQLGPALKAMAGRYQELKMPVTIIAGDSDLIAPAEENSIPLHQAIPNSRLILLPKTGHLPAFTKPDEVVNAIEDAWKVNNAAMA